MAGAGDGSASQEHNSMKIALMAASAIALSAAAVAPTFAQTTDWSGAYLGGHIGYGKGRGGGETILFDKTLDGVFNDTVTTAAGANAFSPGFCGGAANGSTPAAGCKKDGGGLDYGLRAGYDWQMANGVVLGVVGEVSKTNVDDSVTAFSTTPAFYTMTREVDWMAAIRGRAGFAMDRWLPYVTGGFVRANVDRGFSTSNTANTFTSRGDSKASGWQLGGGVETMVGTNWSLGVEYLYTRLDDDSYRVRAQGPAPAGNPFLLTNAAGTDFARADDRFDMHSVRATLAYRF